MDLPQPQVAACWGPRHDAGEKRTVALGYMGRRPIFDANYRVGSIELFCDLGPTSAVSGLREPESRRNVGVRNDTSNLWC
jgi:hypothetical protein